METPLEFLYKGKKLGLCGVKLPFWINLPYVDICKTLSLDLLHSFYKFFYNHVFHWNRTGLGAAELDACLALQIQLVGDCVFAQGVLRISQMSGKDHRDLMRTQVAVVAGGPNDISTKVTRATQAVINCISLAQYSTMTDSMLQAYKNSYLDLQNLKHAWIENKTRRGKRGVIKDFDIPKMHNLCHLSAHVCAKGPPDNYSTETMERLHIVLIKDAYQATNCRNWAEQST